MEFRIIRFEGLGLGDLFLDVSRGILILKILNTYILNELFLFKHSIYIKEYTEILKKLKRNERKLERIKEK